MQVLGDLVPTSSAFRTCLRELRRTCGIFRILPRSYTLPDFVLRIDDQPIVWGYYGNVHKGSLDGSEVRVKRLSMPSDAAGQDFTKVCYPYHHFSHPPTLENPTEILRRSCNMEILETFKYRPPPGY